MNQKSCIPTSFHKCWTRSGVSRKHKSPSFAVIQDAGESIPSIAMQDRDTLEKGESEGFQEVATVLVIRAKSAQIGEKFEVQRTPSQFYLMQIVLD